MTQTEKYPNITIRGGGAWFWQARIFLSILWALVPIFALDTWHNPDKAAGLVLILAVATLASLILSHHLKRAWIHFGAE